MKNRKWVKGLLAGGCVIAMLVGIYAYRNLNYDYDNSKFMQRKGRKLGLEEKQYKTADGCTINYIEGPNNGPALLLLHGQMVSWEDYAKVLPRLCETHHVFALDYYGHGGSSKVPEKYSAVAIGRDVLQFMDDIIGKPAMVSGHSSGALLAAWLGANGSGQVSGVLLEDGPFFSTEKGRAESTISWLGFKDMHDFLNQDEIKTYTEYYLEYDAMQRFFKQGGNDAWSFLVKDPAMKRMRKDPTKVPVIWYYPPEIMLNQLLSLTKNYQDGTGDYDLRFGETFYDFSWFDGFDQAETLAKIDCPTLIMHVAAPEMSAPSYYDEAGTLIAAMDEKDAARVNELVKGSVLRGGYKSMHDIHADLPEEFLACVDELSKMVELGPLY